MITVSAQMTFPDAIKAVMNGERVTRLEWRNPAVYVMRADGFLKIQLSGAVSALIVSDADMFADDWYIVGVTH